MSSISWGRRDRYKFTSGGSLSGWVPPALPAIYAITYQRAPQDSPKSHTVLYFGESADLSQEAPALNQKVLASWIGTGGTVDDLYVFIHSMSGSTKVERNRVCQQLVLDYQPFANAI